MSIERKNLRRRAVLAAAVAAAGLGQFPLNALGVGANAYQGPGGTPAAPVTGNFSTTGNWTTTTPAAGGSATLELDFSNSGANTYVATDDLAGALQLNILQFGTDSTSGGTSATIAAGAGNSLNFVVNGATAPTVTQNGSSAFTVSAPVTATNALTFNKAATVTQASAGLVTFSGTFANAGGLSVTGGNYTISGVASGAGTIAVSGGGSLNLTNTANTFTTSAVTVDGAGSNLTLQSGGSFGQAPGAVAAGNPPNRTLTLTNGGQVTVNSSYDLNVTNGNFPIFSIGTGGGVINQTAGTLLLNDANEFVGASGANLLKTGAGNIQFQTAAYTFTGAITINQGTIQVDNASSLGTATSINVAPASSGITGTAGAVLNVDNTQTLARPIQVAGTGIASGGALINGTSGNTATLTGGITLTADASVGGAGNLTVSTAGIAGGFNLTKVGAGIVSFNVANSYTGTTTVAGGALRPTAAANLPAGNIVLSGGALEPGYTPYTTALGTGAGQVQFAASQPGGFSAGAAAVVVNLGGAAAQVQWGSATFNPSQLILNQTTAAGTLDFQNPIDLNGAARTVNVATGTLANTATISGAVTNSSGTAAGLTKTGTGVLVLTNAGNTYNGPTLVSAGGLRATDGTSLPAATNLSLNGGVYETAVNFSRALGTNAGQVQLPGGASGFSAFGGPVVVNFGGAGAAVQWGGATFNPTSLVLNAANANNTVDVRNGIDLNGAGRTVTVNAGAATATAALISGPITNSNATAAGLTKNGGGLLVLTNAGNTYNGGTSVTGGVLRATDGTSLPAAGNLSLNAGVLESSGTFSRAAGTGAGQVQLPGGASGFSAFGAPLVVNVGGAAATLQWGSATFNPSSLVLNAGTANSTVDFRNGIDVNGAARTVAPGGNVATISGVISNSSATAAGLTVNGAGTLVLTGANTYNGTTTLTAGTLSVGAVNNLGASAAPLAINGGTFQVTSAGPTFDLSSRAGAVTFGAGTFSIEVTNPNNTVVLPSATVFTAGSTVTKLGPGTLKVTGTTSAGTVKILNMNGGTLDIGTATLNISNAGADTLKGTADSTINATGGGKIVISTAGGVNFGDNSVVNGVTLTINAKVSGGATGAGFEYCCNNPGGTIVLANAANDFDGQILFSNAGTIAATTIKNTGVASSLGTAGNLAGTQAINFNGSGGRIQYIGTGDTTDRTINFNNNGTLDQSGTGLLKFTGAISQGNTAKTITLQGSTAGTGEVASVIANGSSTTVAVTKAGTGTWTLSGANTYTGATAVNAGTLALGGTGSLAATTVTVANGATFAVTPGTTGATNAAAGAVTLNGGANFTMADGAASTFNVTGATQLAPGGVVPTSLTFDIGGATTATDVVAIAGAGTVGAGGAKVTFNGVGTTALTPGATFNFVTAGSGLTPANFSLASTRVVVNGTAYQLSLSGTATTETVTVGSVVAAAAYFNAGAGAGTALNATGGTGATNFSSDPAGTTDLGAQPTAAQDLIFTATNVTTAQTIPSLGQNYTVNSVGFTAAAPAVTVNNSPAFTLTVNGGGISSPAGAAAQTLNVPVALAAPQTFANNSANPLTLGSTVTAGTNPLTVTGTGTTNIGTLTSTGNLIKTGAGTLGLTGTTGGSSVQTLFMNGGTLDVGAGTLNVNNGGGDTLKGTANSTINGTGGGKIVISTGGGTNFGDNSVANGVTLTINAKVSGAAAGAGFEYCCDNPGGTIALNNVGNDFDGDVIFNTQGTVATTFIANKAVVSGLGKGNQVVFNSGGSRLQYTGAVNSTTDRTLVLAASAVLDQSGTGGLKFTANPTVSGANVKTLTLQGATTGIGELAGALADNSAANTTSVSKLGTGTWVLSGANTYTGTTSITAGSLYVNGTQGTAAAPSGAYTITAGATLGGTGTINVVAAGVSIASGATLAPGGPAAPGSMTVSGVAGNTSNVVTLSPGSNFQVFLTHTAGSELFVNNGSVSLAGANLVLVQDGSVQVGDQYTIIDPPGNIVGQFATGTSGTSNGISYLVSYNTSANPQTVTLSVTAVPEPAAAGLLGLAAVGLLARRRRRA